MMKKILIIFISSLFLLACSEKKSKKQVEQVNADPNALFKKYNLDKIKLPPGFTINVYAEVPNARSITLSPSGVYTLVTEQRIKCML